MIQKNFQAFWVPTSTELFFTKNDATDLRLGDWAKESSPPTENDFKSLMDQSLVTDSPLQVSLWGYPDDEGILLNGGRIGAALAPFEIRKFLFKMTPPAFNVNHSLPWDNTHSKPISFLDENPPTTIDSSDLSQSGFQNSPRLGMTLNSQKQTSPISFSHEGIWKNLNSWILKDWGNLSSELSLGERHELGRKMAFHQTQQKKTWVSFGGGHDYGYADGAGFLDACLAEGQRPLIINIDAHMDVRPITNGLNSGTPFRRLLESYPGKFDFIELGIQSQCNSLFHIEWARSQGCQIISWEEIEKEGSPLQALVKCLEDNFPQFDLSKQQGPRQPLWLSLDIDGLTSNEAPGCSQSWVTGIKTTELFTLFSFFKKAFSWNGMSLYEVSPPLDNDSRTSKLAALIAHRFISLSLQQ